MAGDWWVTLRHLMSNMWRHFMKYFWVGGSIFENVEEGDKFVVPSVFSVKMPNRSHFFNVNTTKTYFSKYRGGKFSLSPNYYCCQGRVLPPPASLKLADGTLGIEKQWFSTFIGVDPNITIAESPIC